MMEEVDRLSNLPEALISTILSMIPTKKAVATSILSKRWRYAYRSVTHLQLLHETLVPTSDDDHRFPDGIWASMLDSVQLSVQGPVHSCTLSFNPSPNCNITTYVLRLHSFIRSLIAKRIKDLSVANKGVGCYELPLETFFCQTLQKLEISKCMLSVLPTTTIYSTNNIKTLVLFRVHFTNDQFRKMISCCKLLELLKVDSCVNVRHMDISAPKLSSLEIVTLKRIRVSLSGVTNLKEARFRFLLTFENSYAPYCNDSSREEDDGQSDKLVRLLTHLSQCNVERLSLQFCRVFCECLEWRSYDGSHKLPQQYQLQALKKLNLDTSLSSLRVAPVLSCLLSSCPNLRELDIQDKDEQVDTTIGSFWDQHSSLLSTLNNLRVIRIHGVRLGQNYWIGFVKFLMMNASTCERITLIHQDPFGNDTEVEQMLRSFPWASTNAVLEVKSLKCTGMRTEYGYIR